MGVAEAAEAKRVEASCINRAGNKEGWGKGRGAAARAGLDRAAGGMWIALPVVQGALQIRGDQGLGRDQLFRVFSVS